MVPSSNGIGHFRSHGRIFQLGHNRIGEVRVLGGTECFLSGFFPHQRTHAAQLGIGGYHAFTIIPDGVIV